MYILSPYYIHVASPSRYYEDVIRNEDVIMYKDVIRYGDVRYIHCYINTGLWSLHDILHICATILQVSFKENLMIINHETPLI